MTEKGTKNITTTLVVTDTAGTSAIDNNAATKRNEIAIQTFSKKKK